MRDPEVARVCELKVGLRWRVKIAGIAVGIGRLFLDQVGRSMECGGGQLSRSFLVSKKTDFARSPCGNKRRRPPWPVGSPTTMYLPEHVVIAFRVSSKAQRAGPSS